MRLSTGEAGGKGKVAEVEKGSAADVTLSIGDNSGAVSGVVVRPAETGSGWFVLPGLLVVLLLLGSGIRVDLLFLPVGIPGCGDPVGDGAGEVGAQDNGQLPPEAGIVELSSEKLVLRVPSQEVVYPDCVPPVCHSPDSKGGDL